MAETTDLEFENLNDVVQFLDKKLGNMTWTGVARTAEMDHGVVYEWARGEVKTANIFLVQCLAYVLDYDLTVCIRKGCQILVDTRDQRKIGSIFRRLRENEGMRERVAAAIVGGTLKSLREFEDGLKEEEKETPCPLLGLDRIQALGQALGVKVTVVLRKQVQAPVRLVQPKQPIYTDERQRMGMAC